MSTGFVCPWQRRRRRPGAQAVHFSGGWDKMLLGKTAREEGNDREVGGSMASLSLSKLRETVKDKGSLVCCRPWGHKSWTQLSD